MSDNRKEAPYGSWKSPISAAAVASAPRLNYLEPKIDGDENVYWIENRPSEAGRYVVVRRTKDGNVQDLVPPGFNARNRVHEYGGGAYLVAGGHLYFSNFSDERVYRQELAEPGAPKVVTPGLNMFYADYEFDSKRNKILCVREDHTLEGREAVNEIVAIDPEGKSPTKVLLSGNDFYSSPRISPDGAKLAWLTWNHPNMPFFSSELWIGDIGSQEGIEKSKKVAGGPHESVALPKWSPNGLLHFVSDRTGWWNIYRLRKEKIEPLYETSAEFGVPHWVFGQSTYDFCSDKRIISIYEKDGMSHLAFIDTEKYELSDAKTEYTDLHYVVARQKYAVMTAGAPESPISLVRYDYDSARFEILAQAKLPGEIQLGFISRPEPLEYPTTGGLTSHALFYPPKNEDYKAPEGDLPPLVVISHGGPTSATTTILNLGIQYFTSRGFAVLAVNYGGSTGYGREYRLRLKGNWGVVDVDDCANGALYLAREGKADPKRLIIKGGSAGGYTTLCALAFRKDFKAGASYFGLSDLDIFVHDTHKFESRYLDHLIGPYPEQKELYRKRSAINYLDQFSAPIIFLQGAEDKVVPPNQAELMFEALKKKGIPTAYILFEGEQHGFRQAQNIARAQESELYFYSKVLKFEIADKVEPVKIENLEGE
jgi:dipeptidyl aminopeptidase/acylaminoacyl peptidase